LKRLVLPRPFVLDQIEALTEIPKLRI